MVRKSLVYAALTGLLVAGYYALVQSAGAFLSREFGVSEAVWVTIAVVVLAIMFAPVRERVQGAVDRLFYRTEYVYKQEVIDFGRRVARTLTREEILDHFIGRCDALLHPSFVAVYLRGEDKDLVLERVHGAGPEVPPPSPPIRSWAAISRATAPRCWSNSSTAPGSDPTSTPTRAVCSPRAAGRAASPSRRPTGCSVSRCSVQKRSGLVYRRADGELLETFAEQLALVIENADLIRSSIEKERLKSEVMLARDIQQALLPADRAALARTSRYTGQMISSSEVGGDYFDYFPLDDRRIVVAIGDVMGKGVPAAMLMASLQAVFKNRAVKGGLAPHELNAGAQRLPRRARQAGQFATFFLRCPRPRRTPPSPFRAPASAPPCWRPTASSTAWATAAPSWARTATSASTRARWPSAPATCSSSIPTGSSSR